MGMAISRLFFPIDTDGRAGAADGNGGAQDWIGHILMKKKVTSFCTVWYIPAASFCIFLHTIAHSYIILHPSVQ